MFVVSNILKKWTQNTYNLKIKYIIFQSFWWFLGHCACVYFNSAHLNLLQ